MKTRLKYVCWLGLTGLCLTLNGLATEVSTVEIRTTNSTKFSYVCSCKPGVNYPEGKPTILHQGFFNEGGGQYANCSERFLMQFDLPNFPSNTVIASAKLDLRCMMFYGKSSGSLVYGRILEPWDKNKVNFTNQPVCSANDLITLTDWPKSESWITVDMTDWVRGWVQGTFTNYGFMGYSEGSTVTSSLMLYAPGGGASTRPKLTLVVKNPTPSRLEAAMKDQICEITLYGDTNATYCLQSSTNLLDWHDQTQFCGTNLPCCFRPQSNPAPCQYYRSQLLDWKE
jgi:hypothetical protein